MLKFYVDLCLTPFYLNNCFTRILLNSMAATPQPCKKKIALIACVKQKKDGKHLASDLFTSAWFVKAKEYVESAGFDEYYILSAKHYLVSPSDEIEGYTEHLNQFKPDQIKHWAQVTAQRIKEKDLDREQLIVLGSEKYRSVVAHLPDTQIKEPLKGMGISQQMAWMHQQAAELPNRLK